MLRCDGASVRLLDAGAGVGSLTAAVVAELCKRRARPQELRVAAFEVDPHLAQHLRETLVLCGEQCQKTGMAFEGAVRQEDFIEFAVSALSGLLNDGPAERFNGAILNPPYRKIGTHSRTRHLLQQVDVETSNLYTAFLALVALLLEPGGELVAITPRSFCNGPYFKPFRKLFLRSMDVTHIHIFESRNQAFSDDDVLQENIIFHAIKRPTRSASVVITACERPDEPETTREVAQAQFVNPDDPDLFIHIIPDEGGDQIAELMGNLGASLPDLGLSVSTGRVVDFRSRPFLRPEAGADTVPLIYPTHFADGWVHWPKPGSKKPNAIAVAPQTEDLLVPSAIYVLVKRFSPKEEKHRVVAALYDPTRVRAAHVGFENHLNYFHQAGAGLPLLLAKGLAAFLNSTLLDGYFRQFNGHTQVNATDLRSLKYPMRKQLEALGSMIGEGTLDQVTIDHLVEKELIDMRKGSRTANLMRARRRIEEALSVLAALGFPQEQKNERSALTLLALLDLKPNTPWTEARNPLCGITPMMEYFSEHYGRKYAPNSRETVRRFTVHQFEQAGMVLQNPDKPRPINSPDNVYQIEPAALALLRTFGTPAWEKKLASYKSKRGTLSEQYAAERSMQGIPVTIPGGKKFVLSPGGQNVLIKEIIEKFCPFFTPGGIVLYVGDAGDKFPVWEKKKLAELGVTVDEHGKMPDVVVFHNKKKWLVLIEAVTSHGPVNAKRHKELKELFRNSKVGLVFVTAFLDRHTMSKYLAEISWETEVWVAESPTHLIHFNGERFLGPYA